MRRSRDTNLNLKPVGTLLFEWGLRMGEDGFGEFLELQIERDVNPWLWNPLVHIIVAGQVAEP